MRLEIPHNLILCLSTPVEELLWLNWVLERLLDVAFLCFFFFFDVIILICCCFVTFCIVLFLI